MKRSLPFILLTTMLFSVVSCTRFLEIPPPKDELIRTQIFEADASATGAIYGLYYNMNNSYTHYALSQYLGLYADEMISTNTVANNISFMGSQLTADNGISKNLWSFHYQYIFSTNQIIEGLEASTALSAGVKDQVMGEAKFLRALSYFRMINLFGGVPLVVTSDYTLTANLPRADSAAIYTQIIADLKDAVSLLKPEYPAGAKTRANKWAAKALLAKVYLYTGNWANAELQATDVLSSGSFTPLVSPATNIFLKGSKEAIFQMSPNSGIKNSEANLFVPGLATAIPVYVLRDGLVNAFDSDDLRKKHWMGFNTVGGVKYYYPFKMKDGITAPAPEAYTTLRAGEQFLIRAEARARQGNVEGAITDIDVIRSRAGIPLIRITRPTISKDEMLLAIENERRLEMFAEQGNRWFDIKRAGKADAIMKVLKPSSWKPTAVLFPIPLEQLNANTNLQPNPGYEN